ncbi:MAG: DNA-binding protein [Methylocystaceae bacterium]|nr:DNA-binding protein [Methylocystaceae bacterium]
MSFLKKHRYLNTAQAASILQLSSRTLEKFRIKGGGPVFMKFGVRVYYRPEDLFDWVERAVRTSTSDPGPMQSQSVHKTRAVQTNSALWRR